MPKTGDSAYMPAMCRLSVTPMIVSVAPWWSRCTGVIAITATITPWAAATAKIAYRATRGWSGFAIGCVVAPAVACATTRCASSSGSGRSATK